LLVLFYNSLRFRGRI